MSAGRDEPGIEMTGKQSKGRPKRGSGTAQGSAPRAMRRKQPVPEPAVLAALHEAAGHQKAGDLVKAEVTYRRVLERYPDQPDALHLLGIIMHRRGQSEALEAELSAWFAPRTTQEAADKLSSHSVPCSPVNTVKQAATDPHVTEREIMMEVPDPVAGTMWVTGKTIKFSRTPMVVGSTPLVGEHTREVLQDILGYDEARVRALHEAEIVRSVGSATAAAD